jgi:hypothetical protein
LLSSASTRRLKFAAATLLVAALLVSWSTAALADSPCVNGLPHDTNYANGVWLTGGGQTTGIHPLPATRGNIRTYNGYVANPPWPYAGATASWIALAGESPTNPGKPVGAQVGWAKASLDGHVDAHWFFQWTFSDGQFAGVEYFNTVFPPSIYTYEVYTTNGASGGKHYVFNAGGALLGNSIELFWNPRAHQAYSEVQNFSGDQLPGDTTAHVTFRSVQWSPDRVTWNGSGLVYEKGTPLMPGHPDRGDPPYQYDELSWTDGSNFDTWDTRCP